MNETIKAILRNYDIEEFVKTFGSNTSELLELLFERYFNSWCEMKVHHFSHYDIVNNHKSTHLEFACYKYSYGEIEHVIIDYNIAEYNSLSVEEFLTLVNNQMYDEFFDNREKAVELVDKLIDDYILPRKED